MKSNSETWSDELVLISRTETTDTDGYKTYTETTRSVICNFAEGVSISEFYSHNKDGYSKMAQAEVNYFEYDGEKLAEFNSVRYEVVRSYPVSLDVTRLILEEVVL